MSGNLVAFGGLFVLGFWSAMLADRLARRSVIGALVLGSVVASGLTYGYSTLLLAFHPEFTSSTEWTPADVIMATAVGTTAVVSMLLFRSLQIPAIWRAGFAAMLSLFAVFGAYLLLASFGPASWMPT